MARAFDFKKFSGELLDFTTAVKEKVGLSPSFLPCFLPQIIESIYCRFDIDEIGSSGQIHKAGAPSVSAGAEK